MTTRRELEKLAKAKGFYPTNKGKGSHTLWEHEDGRTIQNRKTTNPKR